MRLAVLALAVPVRSTTNPEPQTLGDAREALLDGGGMAGMPDFDAVGWNTGKAGFGTRGTPGAAVRTEWNTADIWLRREFTLPASRWENLNLRIHHDEDAEVFINGAPAATAGGYTTDYEEVPLNAAALAALKAGRNVIAVHCHQTVGGQYIDVGLVEIESGK